MSALLSLRQVERRFEGRAALAGVTLEVAAGELVALVGANGAGKSTLLRAAAGRLRLDAGCVLIEGRAPRDARGRLGFTPQDPALFPHLTVRENVLVFAGLAGVPRREAGPAADRAIARVGLAAETGRRAETLSGGMKKRASLAAGVAHRPAVVLADEPVAGVDLAAREHVHALLRAARDEGAAVLMATHDLEGAERAADRVVVLDAGSVAADAPPARLMGEAAAEGREVTFLLRAAPSPDQAAALAGLALGPTDDPRVFAGRLRSAAALATVLDSLASAGLRIEESRVREPGLRAAVRRLTGAGLP